VVWDEHFAPAVLGVISTQLIGDEAMEHFGRELSSPGRTLLVWRRSTNAVNPAPLGPN
jgi:hypothetical protein